MKLLLNTITETMLLTEREARKNIKKNFENVPRAEWKEIIEDVYGLQYERTIEREVLEVLEEDLDGNELE
jgi:hypothetical protein